MSEDNAGFRAWLPVDGAAPFYGLDRDWTKLKPRKTTRWERFLWWARSLVRR
jgi:hypothetical protein